MLPLWLLTSSVARADAGQGGTSFSVVGNRIMKNGNEFVIHGVNVNGPGWRWTRKTVPDFAHIVNIWKFNLVRVTCGIRPRNEGQTETNGGREPNDLDAIVRTFTAQGIVVVLDPHDHPGNYYEDPAQPANSPSLSELIDWQKRMATRYKSNPYVWFEVMGNPGRRDEKPGTTTWRTVHERVIQAIRRDAGANNLIVCDGRGDGRDEGQSGALPVPEASSAILTYGQELAHRYSNLLFAFVVDGVWDAGVEKLADYVDRVRAKGLAIFVSEYGHNSYPDSDPATDAMFAVCKPRHIGRCVWHWMPGESYLCAPDDENAGWLVDASDGSKPTNLSWLGDRVWDDNHGLNPIHGPALDRTGWVATAFASSKEGNGHYNQPDEALSAFVLTDDYWSSRTAQVPGQWFQVDMGAIRAFSRLSIDAGAKHGEYPRGYEIYVSNDGTQWGNPIAQGHCDQTILRLSFSLQRARYIKIVQTGKTYHQWSIADFQVYAPVGATPDLNPNNPNLNPTAAKLPAKTPAGNSLQNQAVPNQKAVVEIMYDTHHWLASSDPKIWNVQLPLEPNHRIDEYAANGRPQEPGQFYSVDMGEPQRFHKIVLNCGHNVIDYPRGYELYVSNDGKDWGKPIVAGRGAPITTITFPQQTARYFKITLTRYGRNYWSLGYIHVYGSK